MEGTLFLGIQGIQKIKERDQYPLASSIDIFPTLVDLEFPADKSVLFDGQSLLIWLATRGREVVFLRRLLASSLPRPLHQR